MKNLDVLARFAKVKCFSAIQRRDDLIERYEMVADSLHDLDDLYYDGEENAEVTAQHHRAVLNLYWLDREVRSAVRECERLGKEAMEAVETCRLSRINAGL